MKEPRWRRQPLVLASAALLLFGLVLNLRQGETELAWLEKRPSPPPLRPGEIVPSFQASLLYPKRDRLAVALTGDRVWVLLIYSPRCGHCNDTWPIWSEVLSQTEGRRNSVLALSTLDAETTVEHARQMNVPFSVALFGQVQDAAAYRVSKLPVTLILSGSRVQWNWTGPVQSSQITEFKKALAEAMPAEPCDCKAAAGNDP